MTRQTFCKIMKYGSLALWGGCLGAAIGSAIAKDYPRAMGYVVLCAANHFCYNEWTKEINKP